MDLRDQLQAALADAFVVGRELGGGGMSVVFLVEDRRLGRTLVAKVLAPELASAINAERFEREIRLAASLQQANIVPLLDAGGAGGLPWFTMPYVEGESLRTRLASGPPITTAECVSILRDVTRALGYAHERGVVHRDIKPDNVLLSHGTAEVTDFGIAKAIDAARRTPAGETLTQLGTTVGTPAYMSPEQAAGDPSVDARSDIYSVGILAYEMLAGHPPFTGTPQSVIAAQVYSTPAPIARRDGADALERVVMRCLAKNPADRYQSAAELLKAIDSISTAPEIAAQVSQRWKRRTVAGGIGILALIALGWFGTSGMRRERWARSEAPQRVKQYADLAQYDSAWMIYREARRVLPNDSPFASMLPLFAGHSVLKSEPAGARVYRAPFDDTTHWTLLGTTPTDTMWLPIGFGRVRVEKEGFRTVIGLMSGASRTFLLDSLNAPDSEMVHVPGGTFGVFLVGLEGAKPVRLGDYRIDRVEVTNREYKAFVDAGGYSKREYWPPELSDAERARFVDRTNRPGPATWEAGDFPSGQGELPVGGLSWYEAKAYARFRGKSLPTIYHWARAAQIGAAKYVVPGSNFDSQGPVRANTARGMSPLGTFDMAGNVREWCENADGRGERYILGGGFSDPAYGFTDAYAQPPGDRSAINGVRLMKYVHDEAQLALANAPVTKSFRDFTKEKPVSNAVFEGYRSMFDYDRTPLNAKTLETQTTDEWVMERVSFDAAYGKERMAALVFTPKNGHPPYQPVVYFPGSGVINQSSSRTPRDVVPAFYLKSGRALIYPILKSTYERQDSLKSDVADSSIFWRDHVVMWVKDMRRTLDYVATRADMDTSRIGYFGFSWGSNQAPVVLATEPRFKAAVLYVAGLTMERSRPEVDPFNYLPHVTQPLIMLDGKYDFFFPVQIAQKPFFDALGTPLEHRKYLVYEGGHDVPREELIKEGLAWFDKYLGPVR